MAGMLKEKMQHLYFDVIVAHFAIGIIKMSVLELYKRIFTTKRFKLWANVLMILITAWTLGAFLVCLRIQ
jgi:hypothetical protein